MRVLGHVKIRNTGKPFLQGDREFGVSEKLTRALMDAVAERRVASGRSPEIHLEGVGVLAFVLMAAREVPL